MEISEFVLDYIVREQGRNIAIPNEEKERFELYKQLIKSPFELNESFIKTESIYLKNILASRKSLEIPPGVSVTGEEVCFICADVVINRVDDTENDIYLFSGSAYKKVIEGTREFPSVVQVPSLLCKTVITNHFPVIDNRATSQQISIFIKSIADCIEAAAQRKYKSIAYYHQYIPNKLLEQQLIKSVSNLFLDAKARYGINSVISVKDLQTAQVYKKYLQ